MLPYWGTQWDAPVDDVARLNAALRRLWPVSERAVWLLAYWEPGEFWSPGRERIVVAAMQPGKWYEMEDHFYRAMGHGSEDSKLAELNGPNPRRGAEYCPPHKLPWSQQASYPHGKLVYPNDGRLPATITERQWLLWREHHALAVPIWIVQGTGGGHPVRWTKLEVAMSQVLGAGTVRPPEIGALPYASGDRRVVERLDEWQTMQRLSTEVRDEWFRIPEEGRTEPERRLHALFEAWYDDRVENRLDTSSFQHAAFV